MNSNKQSLWLWQLFMLVSISYASVQSVEAYIPTTSQSSHTLNLNQSSSKVNRRITRSNQRVEVHTKADLIYTGTIVRTLSKGFLIRTEQVMEIRSGKPVSVRQEIQTIYIPLKNIIRIQAPGSSQTTPSPTTNSPVQAPVSAAPTLPGQSTEPIAQSTSNPPPPQQDPQAGTLAKYNAMKKGLALPILINLVLPSVGSWIVGDIEGGLLGLSEIASIGAGIAMIFLFPDPIIQFAFFIATPIAAVAFWIGSLITIVRYVNRYNASLRRTLGLPDVIASHLTNDSQQKAWDVIPDMRRLSPTHKVTFSF